MGLLGLKFFLCPLFLELSWVPKGSFKQLLIREGIQRQGRSSGETIARPWGKVLVPLQGIFCSVTQSCPTLCNLMDYSLPGFPVLHHLLELAQTHVHWVCDAIQLSHPLLSPFSSCLQSFTASGSFLMNQLYTSGGQNIGASASTSVLKMNIQDWFPLGLAGLISLQSKELSRVFSNTTVQKHQFTCASAFFMVQLSHQYMTTRKP